MNTRKVRRGNNAGMAQITAVIFITIAALVIMAVATRQLDQFNLVQRHEEYQICFDGVESARLHSVAILENGAAAALPAPTGSSAKSGGSEIGASSTKGAVGGAASMASVGLETWEPVYDSNNRVVLPPFDSTEANPVEMGGSRA